MKVGGWSYQMSATTITFGDCAENHAGMQRLGATAAAGFTFAELLRARDRFRAAGFEAEVVDLVWEAGVAAAFDGGETAPDTADVLVVRGGVNALLQDADPLLRGTDLQGAADAFAGEQAALAGERDKQALMRGRVVNKLARHNLCFGEEAQEPNYAAGKGRVVSFADVPLAEAVREALPKFFGPKAESLLAEANYYYDVTKCGIGFHGDTERRIVVGLRLGEPIPLHYQWFYRGGPVGKRVELSFNHGDLYAMSEKAVGFDWKRSTVPTLRHAAGAQKYLTIAN